MLICEYILRERTALGKMPVNPALVSTIVTTNMAKVIAKTYGLHFAETLTGFKYIGEQIKFFEEAGSYNYVFGLEESYGCLAGTHARDKDAIVAVMCLCEVAAFCNVNGETLWDMMLQMYEKYGYYKEAQYTITLKGVTGSQKIAEMMDDLRNNPPKYFGDFKVLSMADYKEHKRIDMETGVETTTDLPTSNVLYFDLPNDMWCCARPSGTEPKIKFYMGVTGSSLEETEENLEHLTNAVKAIVTK